MALPKYIRESAWKYYENFQRASNEQVAAWLEWAKETDALNKKVFTEHYKVYQSMMGLVKELFGDDSKQYKYLEKNGIETTFYYNHFENVWNDYSRSRTEYLQKKEVEDRKLKQASQLADKERKDLLTTWEIAKRYNISVVVDIDPEDVIETLIESNRYLELAHAMLKTRNDWTDGFDRVQYAIQSFEEQSDDSDQDKDIIANVSEVLDRDHEDGRVFRDCSWNYDRLFRLVDPSLMEDYRTLSDIIVEY